VCNVVAAGGHVVGPSSPAAGLPATVRCTLGHAGTPLSTPLSQWSNHANIGRDGHSSVSSTS
jgi:hypothetical protein